MIAAHMRQKDGRIDCSVCLMLAEMREQMAEMVTAAVAEALGRDR